MYVCPCRNINGNSYSLLYFCYVLSVNSICTDNTLNTSSPIRNGTFIGVTFVCISMNVFFSKDIAVLNVPRILQKPLPSLKVCENVRRFGALCIYLQ